MISDLYKMGSTLYNVMIPWVGGNMVYGVWEGLLPRCLLGYTV